MHIPRSLSLGEHSKCFALPRCLSGVWSSLCVVPLPFAQVAKGKKGRRQVRRVHLTHTRGSETGATVRSGWQAYPSKCWSFSLCWHWHTLFHCWGCWALISPFTATSLATFWAAIWRAHEVLFPGPLLVCHKASANLARLPGLSSFALVFQAKTGGRSNVEKQFPK